MNSSRLVSLQTGLPQDYVSQSEIGPAESTWTTAFAKQPVAGPVWVGKTHLTGDGQANTKNHGGVEKAICVYPLEHYAYWREHLALPNLSAGAFAENFTTEGLLEHEVCVGDVFTCGEIVVQISQPRPPCWKLSRWWQVKDFAAQMEQTGWTGWYLRVLQEGHVESGAAIELTERLHPEWSVATTYAVTFGSKSDVGRMKALAACDALSPGWRGMLASKIEKAEHQQA